MNNRSHMLGGMLIVAFLAFILPVVAHTQSGGQQLPKCPEEASGVGGANQSSSNAAAGSNAQCKKSEQEGFYSGKPNKWKCSKDGKEMSNKLDAPCDYSGEGGKVQGKCSADGECKAQKPEGKPPEMPQIPKGEKEKQEQPKMPELKPATTTPCFSGQSTSTASTTSGLFGRYGNSTDIEGMIPCTSGQSGTSTPDLNSWRWGGTTVPNASDTQDTSTSGLGFQLQGESDQGRNGANWTGVSGWDGWIRKANMVSIDESDIGTAGLGGSPDQARAYGSHAQFQQNVGFSQWSSIFNEGSDQLRGSGAQGYSSSASPSASPRSSGSASGLGGDSFDSSGQRQGVAADGSQGAGQVAPSGGVANDDPRSDFYQYTASASFNENNPNAFPAPAPSIIQRAYTSFISTVRNALGL